MKDSEIKELWTDENFFASFSGINNFKAAIFTTFGENISKKHLQKVLNEIPSYIARIKPKKRFPRRPYDVYGFGQVLQADLGVMYSFNGFFYFLLVIDVFSRRIFTEPLKNKQIQTVKAAFENILAKINNRVNLVQTDKGAEMVGLKKFLEERSIRHQYKYGATKCTFAENGIYTIKIRLYTVLRAKNSRDWPFFCPKLLKTTIIHLKRVYTSLNQVTFKVVLMI